MTASAPRLLYIDDDAGAAHAGGAGVATPRL